MLLLSGFTFNNIVSAETISELKEKQSDIKNKRAEVKKELSKTEQKIADVLFDIEELNAEIKELEIALELNEKALKEAKRNIKSLNKEIDELEEEITELEEKIDDRTEILKDRISAYQKTGGNINILEVILGSKNFSDMISRVSAVMKITNADQKIIDEQEEYKAKVEVKQIQVEEKLEEETEKEKEIAAITKDIEQQKETVTTKKKDKEKVEKELQKILKDYKDEDQTLARLEESVRQEIAEAEQEESLVTLASSQPNNNDQNTNTKNNTTKNDTTVPKGGPVKAALSRVGKNNQYVWGGKSPATGFDCSGFVSWAYGGSIPPSTSALANRGKKVDLSQAKPGDLIFFNTYKTNGHVGIYLGNGQWVGSQSSTGVAVANINDSYWKPRFSQVRRIN